MNAQRGMLLAPPVALPQGVQSIEGLQWPSDTSQEVGETFKVVFNDVEFRSQTEARWAIFMSHLGIRWNYEPRPYRLPSKGYLADFYLPQSHLWMEIKGPFPSEQERDSCRELSELTELPVLLTYGFPGWWLDEDVGGSFLFYKSAPPIPGYVISACPACNGIWIRRTSPELHACGKMTEPLAAHEKTPPCVRHAIRYAMKHRFWDPKKRK